jgi:hypothetical protein
VNIEHMQKLFALIFLILLTACSAPQLPLSKAEPLTVSPDALVRPPWETYVQAGPGAEKDIDLETLNGPQVAPAPEALPAETPVAPEPMKTPPKPGDTVIKAVAVLPVTGAKGRGNAELTNAMRKVLKDAGWPVLSAPRADALTIQGSVVMDAAQNGQQPVHLTWAVHTPKGKNLGDIKQNNGVPAGSLDQGWGENAGFATQAAAEGIFKLIEGYR